MKEIARPDFASRFLSAVLAGHPYRDAVLGDLSEECSKVQAAEGPDEARRWYRGQARRSVLPILSSYPLAPGLALRLTGLVVTVYLAAIRASSVAGLRIEHMLGQSRGTAFVASYLLVIAITGGVGGFVVSVVARRHAFVAALFMLAVTVGVGVVHVESGASYESWFRVWKVSLFVLTVTIGLLLGTSAGLRSSRSVKSGS